MSATGQEETQESGDESIIGGGETGFDAFMRAVASAPDLDSELADRHRRLDAGGVVIGGSYAVGERIGRGGLATVYRAHDRELDRPVAVKVLRLELVGTGLRGPLRHLLEREARATATLNHPNLITVHRFGMWEGLPFMVVELLAGESLGVRIARGPLPLREALEIADQILAGLEHAHGLGVLHRDLSPGNVFVRSDGVVKILDFGLSSLRAARADVDAARASVPGHTLLCAGTPGHMAPEQERGETPDARADLWSVGVLLEHMMRGGLSVPGEFPPAVAAYLARACAPAPADRFPDAPAMRAALPWPPRRGRRRRIATAAGLAALGLVAALVGGLALREPATVPPTFDVRSHLPSNAPGARPVSPAEAPAIEGLWTTIDDRQAVYSDPTTNLDAHRLAFTLRRTDHGYWFTSVRVPEVQADLRVIRAGERVYLFGFCQQSWTRYYMEFRVDGADAIAMTFSGWDNRREIIPSWDTREWRYRRGVVEPEPERSP